MNLTQEVASHICVVTGYNSGCCFSGMMNSIAGQKVSIRIILEIATTTCEITIQMNLNNFCRNMRLIFKKGKSEVMRVHVNYQRKQMKVRISTLYFCTSFISCYCGISVSPGSISLAHDAMQNNSISPCILEVPDTLSQ